MLAMPVAILLPTPLVLLFLTIMLLTLWFTLNYIPLALMCHCVRVWCLCALCCGITLHSHNEVQPGSFLFMDGDYNQNEAEDSQKFRQSLFVCTHTHIPPHTLPPLSFHTPNTRTSHHTTLPPLSFHTPNSFSRTFLRSSVLLWLCSRSYGIPRLPPSCGSIVSIPPHRACPSCVGTCWLTAPLLGTVNTRVGTRLGHQC